MLTWLDILKRANYGNPAPERWVKKTDEAWRALLTEEQYRITRQRGTEPAFSAELCSLFEPGTYACVCCGTRLFDAGEKFESHTGWPSFTQPAEEGAVAFHKDKRHGMYRIETTCNVCDAHLGHVFQDGPAPSGLRFCINAAALRKRAAKTQKLTLGGGCFWCTEALFSRLSGVETVRSGYSGGTVQNPTYREVCSGLTGHAEVVEMTYDPEQIRLQDLLLVHFTTHDPTTLNRQGADQGTQYRSVVFYRSEVEARKTRHLIQELQAHFTDPIVTEVRSFEAFYPADPYHQNYYATHPERRYCQLVINPKLDKLRAMYPKLMKSGNSSQEAPGT